MHAPTRGLSQLAAPFVASQAKPSTERPSSSLLLSMNFYPIQLHENGFALTLVITNPQRFIREPFFKDFLPNCMCKAPQAFELLKDIILKWTRWEFQLHRQFASRGLFGRQSLFHMKGRKPEPTTSCLQSTRATTAPRAHNY